MEKVRKFVKKCNNECPLGWYIYAIYVSFGRGLWGNHTSDEELHRGIVYLSAWTSVAVYYLWQAKALKRKWWRSLRFFCVHWIETENNYTLLFINKKTN